METIKSGDTVYVVTDAKNKKVKKLHSFENLDELISESTAMKNTFINSLFSYLKEQDETTTRRNDKVGNWIMCRGYKITWDDDLGFAIYDMHDYGRHCEEFEEPCPTPREVWSFVSSKKSKDAKKEVVVKVTEKTLPKKSDKKYTDKVEEELSVEEYELFRKDLLKALDGLTVPKMADTVFKFIPNRKFNHRVNKLTSAYYEKEIRGSVFKTELLKLVKEHDFNPTKKPAKKFVGVNWYIITSLEVKSGNVEFMTKTEGRFVMSISEFMARYLLHLDVKYMPQMYRYLNGFITKEDFISEPIVRNDYDAKYIDFDISILRKRNDELASICKRILLIAEEPNPMDICYKNNLTTELKVGDFVEVFWKDYHTFYSGKVIDFSGGVRIRYDDGLVIPLYKWQEFDVISKRV